MFYRLFGRIALALGVCLVMAGCSGSKITKANADMIATGMTEQEVSDILGAPTETAEIEIPDVGGMWGGMQPPAMPKMPMPKKAKQASWKEGNKAIVVTFMDGKVFQKRATGF